MNVNVNVKRKYKINGKEYNSIEEMPPDIRSAFEKAMATPAGTVSPSVSHTKIIFNGNEYQNIEEMPPDIRQLYEKVLNAAQTGDIPPGLITNGNVSDSQAVSETYINTGMGDMEKPIKIEPVAFSPRILVIGIALIVLIVMFYLIFQGK